MNRRDLLRLLCTAPIAGMAYGEKPTQRRLDQFGLQLSTITPLLLEDFEGTLKAVADIGYRQVEFSALGLLGRPPARVAQLLEANGLQAPVGRISPKLPDNFGQLNAQEQRAQFMLRSGSDYLLANVRHALCEAQALGQSQLVLPALPRNNFASEKTFKQSLELLKQAGDLCAQAGVRFGYHNHDWEFQPLSTGALKSGESFIPYDAMLSSLDPDIMSFQLDVYWVRKGGHNPLHYLRAHAGRFPSCHLKDMDQSGDFEDVGYGVIDMPEFVSATSASGTQYYFVERDGPPNPMATARRAYDYLQQMRF